MNRSEQINELATALAKAQGEFPNLQKRCKAYNYMYADMAEIMDAIRQPLAKNNLSIINQIHWDDFPRLESTLLHSSGQWMSICIRLAFKVDGKVNEMQAMGSAITYARRYAISCLLNLAADAESDDDGETSAPKGQIVTPEHKPSFIKKIEEWQIKELEILGSKNPEKFEEVKKSFKSLSDIPASRFNNVKNFLAEEKAS